MKTVPGGNLSSAIFPSNAMAAEQMADIYRWLSEQLSEIGLEEFHVRSIVAYFFMNRQDLEDESFQECGVTTNSNGRRQAGFEVIPLQDRRKRCAELYIKNVSAKDEVPLPVVKRIVAELSTRLTAGTQESASVSSAQDQESKNPDYNSDSPMDRYNKAFPPLSEDNSPIQLSPPEDRDNVWTQRRPLTSKLAGETSQKNGAIDRQPEAGTKGDTPSRRIKTGHGKENDLTASTRKKAHPSRRRDLVQYSHSARQLSYPVPQRPSAPAPTSQEDEERKNQIAEYLITALGIKSCGSTRRAQYSSNQPSANTAYSHKPSAPQNQKKEKELPDGSVRHDAKTHSQEARLPAHMFPEQLASTEQSCSQKVDKGVVKRDVASKQGSITQPKGEISSQTASNRSAFPSSTSSDDGAEQHGAAASHPYVQQQSYLQSTVHSERRPQTEVTITADQRHMFAAFSPKDEALASQDACYRILPYEILERDAKKKEKEEVDDTGYFAFFPAAQAIGNPDGSASLINSRSHLPEADVQVLSASLPHTLQQADRIASSGICNPCLFYPHGKTHLKESFSYPSFEFYDLDPVPGSAQGKKYGCFEDFCLSKTESQLQREGESVDAVCCGDCRSPSSDVQEYAGGADLPSSACHPPPMDLGQWIQYFQNQQHWSHLHQGQTGGAYGSCEQCIACISGDPRWCQNQNASSSALLKRVDVPDGQVTFTLGDCGSGRETEASSYCSPQDTDTEQISHQFDPGACYATASENREHSFYKSYIPSVTEHFPRQLLETSLSSLHYAYQPYTNAMQASKCKDDVGLGASYFHDLEERSLSCQAEYSRNPGRRGILCKAYSPLKLEGADVEETQYYSNTSSQKDHQTSAENYSQYCQQPQAGFDDRFIRNNPVDGHAAFPTVSDEFSKYSQSLWSRDDGSHTDHPSLSLVSHEHRESRDNGGGEPDHPLPIYMRHPAQNSSGGSPQEQGSQHPHASKYFGNQSELKHSKQAGWLYERQSPFGYGADMHLSFPSFHQDHYSTSDHYSSSYQAQAEREPSAAFISTTASSSLLEEAGTFGGTGQGSSSEHMSNPWAPQPGELDNHQVHTGAIFEVKHERYQDDRSDVHTRHFQEELDPELQSSPELDADAGQQWQPKEGLLGVDWLPSPASGKDDTERDKDWSTAVDPLKDSWFSPWLQVVNSNNTQSRVFPLLHASSSKRQIYNKATPSLLSVSYPPSSHLHLDRSASDSSILSIPSDTSAFRKYVRSNSLPSLDSDLSSAPRSNEQLPQLPRKITMTPRERQFQPIPAQLVEDDCSSQKQSYIQQPASHEPSPVAQQRDIFGTPTPTEVLSCTDKAIQTGEESSASSQKTLYPSLHHPHPRTFRSSANDEDFDELSPPSTDSEISSEDDKPVRLELLKKSWKEMQDVTDEDRFADAIYYYHHYGTMPHIFPSPQEVTKDLHVMEQAAATDYHFSQNSQMNGYIPSCAVPIPQQALRVEQVEEEMFQSTLDPRSSAYGSHRSRRKPLRGSSKSKQSRGPVYSNKPCSFYLEGQCYRADCKYSHDMSSITCCFWQVGQCFKGDLCPFLHGYPSQDEQGGGGGTEAVESVVELTSEDFPELSGVTQDVHDHGVTFHKKKKVKKSGVRNQIPRGN